MKKNIIIIVELVLIGVLAFYSMAQDSEASKNLVMAEAAQAEASRQANMADHQAMNAEKSAAEAIRAMYEAERVLSMLEDCQNN